MKFVISFFVMCLPLFYNGQFEKTVKVKIKRIDLKDRYSYYDCFLYDSALNAKTLTLFYIFSSKSDSLR